MLRLVFDIVVTVTMSYLIVMAISTGEINIRGAHYSVQTNPIAFYVGIGFSLLLLIIWVAIASSNIFSAVDSRVKKFGGNYNKNTFKAIVKNALGKSN